MTHLQFFAQHCGLIYGVIFEILALSCVRGEFDARDNFWLGTSFTSFALGLILL